jgi:hypothetical protein
MLKLVQTTTQMQEAFTVGHAKVFATN